MAVQLVKQFRKLIYKILIIIQPQKPKQKASQSYPNYTKCHFIHTGIEELVDFSEFTLRNKWPRFTIIYADSSSF